MCLEYPRILVSAGDTHAVPLVGACRGYRLLFIIDQAHNASFLLLFYQGTRGHERGSNLSLGSRRSGDGIFTGCIIAVAGSVSTRGGCCVWDCLNVVLRQQLGPGVAADAAFLEGPGPSDGHLGRC